MIRLLQRKLIIPRGDTGSFTIPVIGAASSADVAIFTIFDCLTHTKLYQKSVTVSGETFTIDFTHNDTVNMKPGKYVWDIKFYKNPQYADDELVGGDEIDSYYAGFSLPDCEIRETGDDLLISPDAPSGTLTPAQLDIISAALTEVAAAVEKTETNVTHYPQVINNKWYVWDTEQNEFVDTGVIAIGQGVVAGGTTGQFLKKKSNTDYDTEWGEELDPTVPAWAKAAQKPSYTAVEVGALPDDTFIPSKVSDLDNDSGFLTTETDPTVPAWAKEQTKPTYTAAEVGLGNVANERQYSANNPPPHDTVKADKVDGAVEGNFAALDANGNLIDSGHAHSDYITDVSDKLDVSLKGAAGGLAELDDGGKVPTSQLPSYVDDVLEYEHNYDFPATGESGKIYVAKDTNKTYRWSGSNYIEISPSLALGETNSTAYRGDRGKIAYDHAQAKGYAYNNGLYKIGTNSEGHVNSATAVEKSDITALGIPAQDTTYESKAAAENGTDVSLVTTGEKYAWNSKYNKPASGIPATDLADGVIPDTSIYATKADTVLTSTLSRGRASGSTVGQVSFAFGEDVTASGVRSHAEGSNTHAIGNDSHAEGYSSTAEGSYTHAEGVSTLAKGNASHAEGLNTIANGSNAHAEGVYTIANGNASHAGGWFNVADTYDSWNEWAANTEYNIGDKVKITNENTVKGYICTTANSDASFTSSKWNLDSQMNYIESIGNGTADNARSNARTLDWEGNEWLKGDLYVGANANGTGGSKVAKVSEIPNITGKADKVNSATEGNFAALDSNGNLIDSGHKHSDYLTEHQSLAGKQDKITASGLLKGDGNGGVSAAVAGTDYIASHQDISGKADKVSSATNGNFAALDSNGNLTDSGHKHGDYLTSVPVTDVQVNGTSVLSNGVANVPYVNTQKAGVVYPGGALQYVSGNLGRLYINPASNSAIKEGTSDYFAISPSKQNRSVFYGLAKAAGDSTQSSSSNAVGTYTADAMKKIRMMLGIPNTHWELINEVTVNEDSTEIKVDTDSNGQAFKLIELIAIFDAGPSTTGNRDNFYGQIDVNYYHPVQNDFINGTTSIPSITYINATSNMYAKAHLITHYPAPLSTESISSSSEGSTQTINGMPKKVQAKYITSIKFYQSASTKSLVPSGAKLTVWGIRYDE